MPRHAANPIEEMKDLKAVLQHLHASNGLGGRVDPNRIALYGASLGGGLVLATASSLAQENNKIKNSIKAVVAAIPLVSGRATRAKSLKERGLWEKVQIMWAVFNDLAWSAFSSDTAVYVQLTRPSSAEGVSAMKISDEEYKIWASRTPLEGKKVDGAWENKLAARTIFWLGQFQPDEMVVNYLEVPTLILAGSEDTLCPIEPIRKMVEMHAAKHEKNKITLKEFPWRHFDFISKENFPLLVENTAAFIRQFF
ncbi:uncharacterized protein EMH_0073770 [Eimeria mitis]|uniref:Alpha/beta hydrolase fold-3 domain-containing protein n=1 Tax=Eimeria mitis TaxID=44415 RepID=U6K7S1_9EIME|nr:uncharacterized protein EMH_0073770 [Eimeria mitis]CDJ32262.1 hypothetical protein, conserved [Eimeria mitis]